MYRSVAINQSHGFWVSLKRTIFMTSLYFRLLREYDPDVSLLEDFNRLFYLVSDPKSLSFPALICRLLWRETTVIAIDECCHSGDIRQAVELIYGRLPRWVRYLDRETMMRDAEQVIHRVIRDRRYS